MKAQNLPVAPATREVLHYTGADDDGGGVMSVVRALAGTGRFACVVGVNPGFTPRRAPPMAAMEFPRIEGEVLGWQTLWRARRVARTAAAWLAADRTRVFHAHSRAGMIAALWLARAGERRVVVSVHCYGRRRWFYRWAARRLGPRLFWLSPAMKRYYGVAGVAGDWTQCIPGCVPAAEGGAPSLRQRIPRLLRLGGVGVLVRWKGWHLVVEALAALPPEIRERVRFDHIGAVGRDDDAQRYAAELRRLTQARGLDRTIDWRGEHASPENFLREIDVLVVASDHEPFSIAVLEALSAGVPVLAADSGGAQDLIVAGRSGWFFRSGDVGDLGRVITGLVERDDVDRAVVAPELVRPSTAPVIADRWEQVYSAL